MRGGRLDARASKPNCRARSSVIWHIFPAVLIRSAAVLDLSPLAKMSIVSPPPSRVTPPSSRKSHSRPAGQSQHRKRRFSHKDGLSALQPYAKVCARDRIKFRQSELTRDATWRPDFRSSKGDAKCTFLPPGTSLLDLTSSPPKRRHFRSSNCEHQSPCEERAHSALKGSEPL